ncbi:hypothetical protein Pelo_9409 [Pelomyxa schiedti]|nr:hypothetical protein Pelo_9409 [Pelomyxa schiedti]
MNAQQSGAVPINNKPLIQGGYHASKPYRICDLIPGLFNVECTFIVLEKKDQKPSKEGHVVHSFLVADNSGTVIACIWDSGDTIQPSDIICMRGGTTTLWNGRIQLVTSKTGSLQRIGEFTMTFSDTPETRRSDIIWGHPPGSAPISGAAAMSGLVPIGNISNPPARQLQPQSRPQDGR